MQKEETYVKFSLCKNINFIVIVLDEDGKMLYNKSTLFGGKGENDGDSIYKKYQWTNYWY